LPNAENKGWATPIIRLEESAENLLKRFHPKHRYEIKKAQKQEHALVIPTEAELHNLLVANSVGNPNYTYPSITRLKALKQNLGDHAAIYGIQSSGKLVAAALILSDASHAYYVYGGSLKGSIGWMHLLQWQIMHLVANQGIEYYDLVGLRPPEGEDQKYEGLAKFKTRFSPEVIRGYTFWVPISTFKVWFFRFLLKIRKVLTGREFKL
jgi:lipid II:glycine glycyltransferase (peptidoglycan interpeptide bridge formation enzyme)